MTVFFKEFRACGLDGGPDNAPDHGTWHTDRSDAIRDLGNLQASYPPYTRTWLEGRTVSSPVELVVTQDTVTPSPRMAAFMAALDERPS